jgi:hypothetical protein
MGTTLTTTTIITDFKRNLVDTLKRRKLLTHTLMQKKPQSIPTYKAFIEDLVVPANPDRHIYVFGFVLRYVLLFLQRKNVAVLRTPPRRE